MYEKVPLSSEYLKELNYIIYAKNLSRNTINKKMKKDLSWLNRKISGNDKIYFEDLLEVLKILDVDLAEFAYNAKQPKAYLNEK